MTEDEGRLTQADKDVLAGKHAFVVEGDQLMELVRAAGETKAYFDNQFQGMTREQAEYVRHLRVEQGYTWRSVAATCALEWSGDWGSNQLAGMAICERAAGFWGEDYQDGVWN